VDTVTAARTTARRAGLGNLTLGYEYRPVTGERIFGSPVRAVYLDRDRVTAIEFPCGCYWSQRIGPLGCLTCEENPA
jgi:hypothetical protein